jgi:hypothetical protein
MSETMCIQGKQEKWNYILIQNRRPYHTEPTTQLRKLNTYKNEIKILYHSNNLLIVTEFSVSTDKERNLHKVCKTM